MPSRQSVIINIKHDNSIGSLKMNRSVKTGKEEWNRLLNLLVGAGEEIFAPVRKYGSLDYGLIDADNIAELVYNEAKPASPLKIFFLPVRLNVTSANGMPARRIIIGAPACDIEGLKLLDAIYIDEKFTDETYQSRREKTIIIGTACHKTTESCHCTVYGLNPWPASGCDISFSAVDDQVVLTATSAKGESFIGEIEKHISITDAGEQVLGNVDKFRKASGSEISKRNNGLPGTEETGRLTESRDAAFWKKHSAKCVTCGACSAICPTCSCFLLIDKPGFEKIKQMDTCQYPAFERVAGGDDPLRELSVRFSNRYKCKYVWKPQRFKVLACTGCGRCTDACIAGINKNQVIREMV